METTKFRAWDKTNSLMCIVLSLNFLLNTAEVIEKIDEDGFNYGHVLHFTPRENDEVGFGYLMRSTGKKDKNGVEIFEGDILKLGGEVKFVEEQDEEYSTFTVGFIFPFGDPITNEVIGNIYNKV